MYAGVPVARATIGLHDNRCPHSSLDGKPPDQAYSSMPMPDGSEAAAAKKTTWETPAIGSDKPSRLSRECRMNGQSSPKTQTERAREGLVARPRCVLVA